MITWKTKLFGDNRMNFYAWIATGYLLIFISLGVAAAAFIVKDSAQLMILVAIYLVLLGQFGLGLQNYCARAAKAIETADEQKR